MIFVRLFIIFLCSFVSVNVQAGEFIHKHVILISFDGLRPDAITALGEDKADAFYHMIHEGASTLNARSDYDYTVTLPNHTTMITGYPVMGSKGHHVIDNSIVDKAVHEYAGRHIYSVFDELHKHGLKSAMLASKLKFNIFSRSYPIDTVSITDADDLKTMEAFRDLFVKGLPDFVFIHFSNPDHIGHIEGWSIKEGSAYMKQVEILNGYLRELLNDISSSDALRDSTIVIATADHGGEGKNHSDKAKPVDYTIPFIIWGKDVAKGKDLYKINLDRRKDPSSKRIDYKKRWQPIHNGDAANLALSLLGLPSVEGSSIGYKKPLKIN